MADEELKLGTKFTGEVDASFRRAVGQIRSIITEVGKAQAKLASNIRSHLVNQEREAARSLQTLSERQKSVASSTATATKNTKAFNNAIYTTTGQVSQISNGLERLKRAFKVITSFGIAGSIIYNFITALKTGVKEIIDFDQALQNVRAITGATTAQLEAMRGVLERVAARTKFSTTELAQGMVLLGQAGFDAEEAIKALPAVADLAAGTLSDMRTITDLVTTSVRAFGLEAIETSRVADIMANAINNSKLTVNKLNTAFNFVGASASQAGLSLEETAAAMGVLANNGQRASTIGTGLRQVLAKLLSPSRKIREEFEALGVDLKSIDPKAQGFEQAIKNLIPVLWDFEKGTVDMGKAFQLFGLRGAQAIAVLAKSFDGGKNSFQEMLETMYEVGSSSRMAAQQAEGLGFKIKNLADSAKLVALAFGSGGVTGAMKALIDILRVVTKGIATLLNTAVGQITLQFTLWTAAIWGTTAGISALMRTGLLSWVGGLTTGIKSLVAVFALWNAHLGTTAALSISLQSIWFKLAKHPFFLIAAAIAGVVVVMQRLITHNRRMISSLQESIVVHQGNINSLRTYKELLEDIHSRINTDEKAQREYSSTVQRLAKDHEELADRVNLATISFSELREEIDKLEKEKLAQANKELVEIINRVRDEAERQAFILKGQLAGARQYDASINLKVSIVGEDLKTQQKAIQDLVTPYAEKVNDGFLSMRDAAIELEKVMVSMNTGAKDQAIVFGALHKALAELEKRTKGTIEAYKKQLASLPEAWIKISKELDAIGFTELVSQKERVESEIAAFRKNAKFLVETGVKSEEDIEAGVQKLWEEGLRKFKESRDKRLFALDSAQKEEMRLESQRLRLLSKLTSDELDKIKAEYTDNEEVIKQWFEKKKAAAKDGTEELAKAESEFLELNMANLDNLNDAYAEYYRNRREAFGELEIKALETEDKQVEATKKRIQLLKQRKQEIKDGTTYLDKELDLQKLTVEILQEEKKLRKEIKDEKKKTLDEERSNYSKYSEDHARITKEMYDEELISAREWARYQDSNAKHWLKTLEEQHRRGIVSWEEYYEALKTARDRGVITETEFKDTEIAERGTALEQFKRGVDQANESWGEFYINLGKQLPGKGADSLTDSIFEFIDGTKSAKEAFKDFARDTLVWMLKMIARQEILNAVMAAKSFFFHDGGTVGQDVTAVEIHKGSGGRSRDIMNAPRRKIGGMSVPQFHKGLGANEILAVLKKNETVFTEGQMATLGEVIRGASSDGGSPGTGPVNYYDLSGSSFTDKQQLMDIMETISVKNVQQHAPNVILGALDDDHDLRDKIRGGL